MPKKSSPGLEIQVKVKENIEETSTFCTIKSQEHYPSITFCHRENNVLDARHRLLLFPILLPKDDEDP